MKKTLPGTGLSKKTLRSVSRYPGLEKRFNLKNRQGEIDYDYLHKLSQEELDWLNRFSEEYIGANFNHPGELIDQTPEGKKLAYNRNNARNRCIYSLSEAKSCIIQWDQKQIERYVEKTQRTDICEEDVLILILDRRD
jgi:hypothetical protein